MSWKGNFHIFKRLSRMTQHVNVHLLLWADSDDTDLSQSLKAKLRLLSGTELAAFNHHPTKF